MDTHTIVWVLQLGLLSWLGALIFIVVFRLMTGAISLDGLLAHDKSDGRGVAERLVLLLATLGFALYYASSALHAPLEGLHPSLPDVPEGVVTALLGANGLYLTGKIADLRKRKGS
jgi:hypothetical protein